MIGFTYLFLKTKKPVSNTGAFGAGTTRTISNLVDSYSVHDTGSMCKDSLLNSQQRFFELHANRGAAAVPGASFRKEQCYYVG